MYCLPENDRYLLLDRISAPAIRAVVVPRNPDDDVVSSSQQGRHAADQLLHYSYVCCQQAENLRHVQ
jgi:hypothetical protein